MNASYGFCSFSQDQFRCNTLGLSPIYLLDGAATPLFKRKLKLPVSYAWSPSILPKPKFVLYASRI